MIFKGIEIQPGEIVELKVEKITVPVEVAVVNVIGSKLKVISPIIKNLQKKDLLFEQEVHEIKILFDQEQALKIHTKNIFHLDEIVIVKIDDYIYKGQLKGCFCGQAIVLFEDQTIGNVFLETCYKVNKK